MYLMADLEFDYEKPIIKPGDMFVFVGYGNEVIIRVCKQGEDWNGFKSSKTGEKSYEKIKNIKFTPIGGY